MGELSPTVGELSPTAGAIEIHILREVELLLTGRPPSSGLADERYTVSGEKKLGPPVVYSTALRAVCNGVKNVWGFIDGTVRSMCRPTVAHRLCYTGHKRVHALKFHSVVAPNGLIVSLYGPVEGRRHDAFLLRKAGLLPQLEAQMDRPNPPPGMPAIDSLNGDPGYLLRAHLLSPHRAAYLTPAEELFNTQMSAMRVSVEWEFGKMLQLFAFIQKKNSKVLLQSIGAL